MKNKFPFVFIAFVSLCISCNKESGSNDKQDPEPKTYDAEFVTAVFPQQTSFINQKYVMAIDSSKVSFQLSEMTPVTDSVRYSSFIKNLIIAEPSRYKIFKYTLGKVKTGQTIQGISRTYSVIPKRPAASEFDILEAERIMVFDYSDGGIHQNNNIYGGVSNNTDSLNVFCNLISGELKLKISIK